MNFKGKGVLVTGGAGFIGSHLVDRLLADGAHVTVLDNLVNGRRENLDARASLVVGDVLDGAVVERAMAATDAVFHLACLGVRHSLHDPVANHRVNAEGTLIVLEAARLRGVARFLCVSSSEVYGTAATAPMNEQHPTHPETIYGAGKLAGEAYARACFRTHGLPVVIVRPFNTYGPRSHFEGDCGEVIPRSIVRVLNGLSPIVFGDGLQTRDFLHVTDTARALTALAACDAAVGRTVNVGYGEETTIDRLVRIIAEAAGRPEIRPQQQAPRPGDVRRLWVDNTLVRRLVGFHPAVALQDGLQALVAWFRSRPTPPAEMLSRMPERNWEPAPKA